jgi:hypothetical protein
MDDNLDKRGRKLPAYEAPAVTVLGSLAEITQKESGLPDNSKQIPLNSA